MLNEEDYNRIRHHDSNNSSDMDLIEKSYRKYRIEFFKYFMKARTEEETIKQLSLKYQYRIIK